MHCNIKMQFTRDEDRNLSISLAVANRHAAIASYFLFWNFLLRASWLIWFIWSNCFKMFSEFIVFSFSLAFPNVTVLIFLRDLSYRSKSWSLDMDGAGFPAPSAPGVPGFARTARGPGGGLVALSPDLLRAKSRLALFMLG